MKELHYFWVALLVQKGQAELVLLDHGLYEVMDKSFRHDYAGLWHALVFADHAQIKKYSQKMNAGELYALFAAILTTKPWDEITEKSVDHLRVRESHRQAVYVQDIPCRLPFSSSG